MSFMFMLIHYPTPEHRDELLHGMVEMAGVFADKPGFIDAGPWIEEGGERIVGISRWESKEAFLASGLTIGGSTETPEGETRPRERFYLEEPADPPAQGGSRER